MDPSIRNIRDRICSLMNTFIDFEQIEKMNPMLGKNIDNVTGEKINNILIHLGFKPVFLDDTSKVCLTELGYPPKPDIVVAFHILNNMYEPIYKQLHSLK